MKKEFLYIVDSFLFYPYAGIRTFELSKRLVKNNITPIILTQRSKSSRQFNEFLKKNIPASILISYTPYFEFKFKYLKNFFDLFLKFSFYVGWVPWAYIIAKKIIKKHNKIKFIYACGPSFETHIIGYFLKRKFGIPLVVEYSDPWSFNPYNEVNETLTNKRINYFFEKRILEKADMIVGLNKEFLLFLKNRFPFIYKKPLISIENGFNFQKPTENDEKKPNEITLTFIGKIYGKREITPFLYIISKLKEKGLFKDKIFLIKIFGNYDREKLNSIISKLKIKNLVFLGGFLQREQLYKEIEQCDFPLHIGENLNYPTLAFKIWEYLGHRKRILYFGREDSFTSKFLTKKNFGITLPINDLRKALNILEKLIENKINNKIINIIDKSDLDEFTWDKRAHDFINYIVNRF